MICAVVALQKQAGGREFSFRWPWCWLPGSPSCSSRKLWLQPERDYRLGFLPCCKGMEDVWWHSSQHPFWLISCSNLWGRIAPGRKHDWSSHSWSHACAGEFKAEAGVPVRAPGMETFFLVRGKVTNGCTGDFNSPWVLRSQETKGPPSVLLFWRRSFWDKVSLASPGCFPTCDPPASMT